MHHWHPLLHGNGKTALGAGSYESIRANGAFYPTSLG